MYTKCKDKRTMCELIGRTKKKTSISDAVILVTILDEELSLTYKLVKMFIFDCK